MVATYLVVKFVHILVAILALGTSAGLGILLEFRANDREHGAFLLRAIRRVEHLVVIPGFVLMLLTGLWLAGSAWSLGTHWIEAAIALWVVGLFALVGSTSMLRRQIAAIEQGGPDAPRYRRLARAGGVVGAAAGLVVVLILWLMVTKPALAFW